VIGFRRPSSPSSPRRSACLAGSGHRCTSTDRSLTGAHVQGHQTSTCCRSISRTRPSWASVFLHGTWTVAGVWKSRRQPVRTWLATPTRPTAIVSSFATTASTLLARTHPQG